ncbi:DNA polymerase IV [uncultured Blautia sp.]|nr:DNA polymerase IV [uncultured Blautia sp.]
MDLTGQLWKPPAPVRALTVTAIHLVRSEDAYEQVDLFTAGAAPKKEKQEKLEAAMDRLRGKFGTDVRRSTPVPSWSRLWQTARCCASLCVWRMASWSCGPSAT